MTVLTTSPTIPSSEHIAFCSSICWASGMADPSTSLCAMGPLVAVPSCREAETGAERRTGRAKQCESSQGRG